MVESNPIRIEYGEQKLKALRHVWKWKQVLPRVKMFIWRAIHDGLTTAWELARRMQRMSPRCVRCDLENEYVMHLLFFCPLSQATWFISRFHLRVDDLPLQFHKTLLFLETHLQPDQMSYLCNVLWCLWKARNEELFAGKKLTSQEVLVQVSRMEIEGAAEPRENNKPSETVAEVAQGEKVILVDGSWDTQGRGGVDMTVYNRRGDLVYVNFQSVQPLDPLHAEALAVLVAMSYVMQEGSQGMFRIFSDNKHMVQVINGGDISEVSSWQAAEAVMSAILLLKQGAHKMQLQFITRKAMRTPLNLANWARRSGKTGIGTPLQCVISHLEIDQTLSKEFFQVWG